MPTQIECPLCKQVTKKRIEELQKNRLIVQFLELNQQKSSNESRYPPQAPPTNNLNVAWTNIKPKAPSVQEIPVYHDFSTNQNSNAQRNHSNDSFSGNSGFSRPENNNNNSHNNNNRNTNSPVWDDRKYFREIFSDIDHNFDGKINFSELHEALIRGMMIL